MSLKTFGGMNEILPNESSVAANRVPKSSYSTLLEDPKLLSFAFPTISPSKPGRTFFGLTSRCTIILPCTYSNALAGAPTAPPSSQIKKISSSAHGWWASDSTRLQSSSRRARLVSAIYGRSAPLVRCMDACDMWTMNYWLGSNADGVVFPPVWTRHQMPVPCSKQCFASTFDHKVAFSSSCRKNTSSDLNLTYSRRRRATVSLNSFITP